MAGTDTITIYRGEAVELTFTMSPVEDIGGWTILFTIRVAGSPDIQVSAVVSGDGSTGIFTVDLSAAVTGTLTAGTYEYDAWRTDTDSERVLAVGSFVVLSVARLPV